ncbi:MAG: hypothetical protein LCH88_01720 [Proteobacteria bacterium]|nr:hypothetical protein [Pseudomonadota bacterium]
MNRRDLAAAVRAILPAAWDPIGIRDEPKAQDEYDDYVPGIVRLLCEGAGVDALAEYLLRIETGQMCLPPDQERARRVAVKLTQLSA